MSAAPTALSVAAWAHATRAAEALGLGLVRPAKGTTYAALRRVESALVADDAPRRAARAWAAAESCWWAMALTVERLAWQEARVNHGPLDIEDAHQEGLFGAFQAAKRYDSARGIKYPTYARWWIRAAITRASDNGGRDLRASSAAMWVLLNARRCRGRTDAEVAAELGIPVARLHEARRVLQVLSLDAPSHQHGGDFTIGDSLVADVPDLDAEIDRRRQTERAMRALSGLPARTRFVVERLVRDDGETLSACGRKLHLSRERVRQIQRDGLEALRAAVDGEVGS